MWNLMVRRNGSWALYIGGMMSPWVAELVGRRLIETRDYDSFRVENVKE